MAENKVVLYIAASLDGYIAREDESLDWLFSCDGEGDNGYGHFYEQVTTILMGKKTYDWIVRHEGGNFPYQGKECYVFSRTTSGRTDYVRFVNSDIAEFVRERKSANGNAVIWVVGGGEVLVALLREQLIDELFIQVAPKLLGRGVPLFREGDYELNLQLAHVNQFNQFVGLHYIVK